MANTPEAIAAVFPRTQVQACIVHLIRSSLDFVSYKDRRSVAAALKEVYRARTAEAGREALDAFDAGPWGPNTRSSPNPGAGTGRR